ncbi:adenosine deaminase 2-like [Prorops nasuta]|uniref:adenosine deaminase 2-like n=1 Tax=Prorops nasuta TaxID=863751 RepID=UPI0034CF149E
MISIMLKFILSLLMVLNGKVTVGVPYNYWRLRSQLLQNEELLTLGGTLQLDPLEEAANGILMTAKYDEVQCGFFKPSSFLPANNFLEARKDIEKSQVFKIIQSLPKGAVLHGHNSALVSTDYIFNNLTYRENLHVCDSGGTFKLQFFKEAPDDCEWKSLQELRENPKTAEYVNKKILQKLSMEVENPTVTYSNVDVAWEKFLQQFDFIGPIIKYRPVFEDHFRRTLQEHYDDNVLYLEMRSALSDLYELDGRTIDERGILRIYKRITDEFIRNNPDFIGVKIIVAKRRMASHKKLENILKSTTALKHEFPEMIAGFDLVGQEDKGNTLASYADILERSHSNVDYLFHAGETNWYGMPTDKNLIDAVLLNTRRIGHGFALTKHPLVSNIAKGKNICIEISPISNQVLGHVKDMRNHPASELFARGFPVVISNDDPGFWGAKALSYDFYEAFLGLMSMDSDLRSLKQLAYNSFICSTLEPYEKERAFKILDKRWQKFVLDLANTVLRKDYRKTC